MIIYDVSCCSVVEISFGSAHLLPTRVLHDTLLHPLQVVPTVTNNRVPLVVLAKRPHEDECDETAQKDDHHEGVEDGEPVDLVLKKFVIKVPLKAGMKRCVGLSPLNS